MNINEVKFKKDESKKEKYENGYLQVSLSSVKKFAKFFVDNFDNKEFVFRGQENGDKWSLETTFLRLSNDKESNIDSLELHLNEFRAATRGRRGSNPKNLTEDELWSLGQHYGLATPLLDWTNSYWVALFFAFTSSKEICEYRAVYAISKVAISNSIKTNNEEIKWIHPDIHDNPRLTSQSGLLLKLDLNESLENWVKDNFKDSNEVVLMKILIPNKDVEYCLRDLNRMNVNHLSLFPDLIGAAEYANTVYKLKNI